MTLNCSWPSARRLAGGSDDDVADHDPEAGVRATGVLGGGEREPAAAGRGLDAGLPVLSTETMVGRVGDTRLEVGARRRSCGSRPASRVSTRIGDSDGAAPARDGSGSPGCCCRRRRTVRTPSPPSVAASSAVTGTTEPSGLSTSTPSMPWSTRRSSRGSRRRAGRGSRPCRRWRCRGRRSGRPRSGPPSRGTPATACRRRPAPGSRAGRWRRRRSSRCPRCRWRRGGRDLDQHRARTAESGGRRHREAVVAVGADAERRGRRRPRASPRRQAYLGALGAAT